MSKPLRVEDAPVILRNTSGRKIIWDRPKSGQGEARGESIPDSVRFDTDGSVRVTPKQLASMGKLPRGVVAETYDPRKHGPKDKMG